MLKPAADMNKLSQKREAELRGQRAKEREENRAKEAEVAKTAVTNLIKQCAAEVEKAANKGLRTTEFPIEKRTCTPSILDLFARKLGAAGYKILDRKHRQTDYREEYHVWTIGW